MNDASDGAIVLGTGDDGDVVAPSARRSTKRRWVGAVIAMGAFGVGALAVQAWLDSRPPSAVTAYVLVVDTASQRTVESWFDGMGSSTFWLAEDGSTTGTWDACSGSGVFADFAPGAQVEFIEGERKSPAGSANPVPVIAASLRNVDDADLSRLEKASKHWTSYVEHIDGVGVSYPSTPSADDMRSSLESLAAGGHACLFTASMHFDDVEFLTVSLPDGSGAGWTMLDAERRDAVEVIVVTGNLGSA